MCARHVIHLGGESPLRAVMSGTASLGKRPDYIGEVASEGSCRRNPDPTNRNRIEGRPGGLYCIGAAMDGDAQ